LSPFLFFFFTTKLANNDCPRRPTNDQNLVHQIFSFRNTPKATNWLVNGWLVAASALGSQSIGKKER
jgi:hypothetical protein